MRKLKMTVAYDGTDFIGFQRQSKGRTIQGTLERALSRVTGEKIHVLGAGRTDRGVHARGQVVHFATTSTIPAERWRFIINNCLPPDLAILEVEEVADDFHAMVSKWKTYRYEIDTAPVRDVFQGRFRTHLPRRTLEIEKMQLAAHFLMGTHDFTTFSSAKADVENRVRTIYDCKVEQDGLITAIEITGSGFLYNMVRIIASVLVDVGLGKRVPEAIPVLLEAKDRQQVGITLAPEGLTMLRVGYTAWE
ncbi:tRNA pseudouridine(38-40) synthase TruA [Mechercharimyces sp. CAU 1602]|uniref:tRNA pseudouridine(38-40) synthase TruA n=1 Tax=Mechercharimyces sp. CAU 1602 TaxID=2973933 RepID=UPI0021625E1B|nr:tRNA pseudouridine(38-40) synthase TruA [Mechercharimyces sp. CAU 1602]MCS1352585.1 tRNA pseudouridine(38-40) synthase TruA [Mechercharimyces sp. CAU 1602]